MSKPLYIFDLDGTLALNDHRKHFVQGNPKPNWEAFFWACDQDIPNMPVIKTMLALIHSCNKVLVFSGRSAKVRERTTKWMGEHTNLNRFWCDANMLFRPLGDFTPDEELKKKWYLDLPQEDKENLIAVFDDRQKVVDMWRSLGIACFQVAEGNF